MSPKMPNNSFVLLLGFVNANAETLGGRQTLVKVSFNVVQFIQRGFFCVSWRRVEFEIAPRQLATSPFASVWPCLAMHRKAAPEAKVVAKGIES